MLEPETERITAMNIKNDLSAATLASEAQLGTDLAAASKAGWAFMPSLSRAPAARGGFFSSLARGLALATSVPVGGLPAGRGPRLGT